MNLTPEAFENQFLNHQNVINNLVNKHLGKTAFEPVEGMVDPQENQKEDLHALERDIRIEPILRRLSGSWGDASTLYDPSVLIDHPGAADALARLESSVTSYGGPQSWQRAFGSREIARRDITRILLHGQRLVEEAIARPYLWERIGRSEGEVEVPEGALPFDHSRYLGDMLFTLGERFLAGNLDAMQVTASWSGHVDEVIQCFSRDYFEKDTPRIAALALGKWGGGELAPDADLDVMLICENSEASEVAAAIQRSSRWLLEASLAGRLLLDPRLRPEGSGAPLVITLQRLEDYLSTRAQAWEKMALVRARVVAGDEDVGEKAKTILQQFTTTKPDSSGWEDVLRARRRTATESTRNSKRSIQIKKTVGGMMDFEFAATLQGWKNSYPSGSWWHDTIPNRLRTIGEDTGDSLWKEAAEAYVELRRWELILSLSSNRRRGEVPLQGDDADRFANALGMKTEEIEPHWRLISGLGRALYDHAKVL